MWKWATILVLDGPGEMGGFPALGVISTAQHFDAAVAQALAVGEDVTGNFIHSRG
jgi:hypothetical protein